MQRTLPFVIQEMHVTNKRLLRQPKTDVLKENYPKMEHFCQWNLKIGESLNGPT